VNILEAFGRIVITVVDQSLNTITDIQLGELFQLIVVKYSKSIIVSVRLFKSDR